MLEDFVHGPIDSRGYPFPGTAELVIEYILAGHFVVLITTATDIDSPLSYVGPHLEIHVMPSRPRARSRALDLFRSERNAIARELARSGADVIHAHWTYEFAIPSRMSSIPDLVTVHDWGPTVALHNKHLYWYFRAVMQVWCLLLPGPLSAPTRYLAAKIEKVYKRSCHVIPNGIHIPAADSTTYCIESTRVGMMNVGFTPLKNVQSALKAWQHVYSENPEYRLCLAGPGYEVGGPAHRWARAKGLDGGVTFDGVIEPQDRLRWRADKAAFLHTSREESFGMVLIESMAAGLPVVAGRKSGAVPEITQGGARLIDVEDPSEIAECLLRLLKDRDERRQLSSLGRELSKKFDKQVVARKYLDLLQTLSVDS